MKVLVCGGRNYANRPNVFNVLDEISPDEVVCGGATGADALAIHWTKERERVRHVYPAKWRTLYGPTTGYYPDAGPTRNQEMLDNEKPDIVIAFPGGPGTADMVCRAREADIQIREVAS